MKKNFKISIITPSFNQGQFIEQTIRSVLDQSYPNLEYIIIDGGSTDNTIDIIKKYEKHLKYWVSETDKGQSDAINKGYKHVSGDIINWINSDDYYFPNTFSKIANLFENPNYNVVCGKSRIFDKKGTLYYSQGTDIYKYNLAKTIGWARIDQPETFFRKAAFDKIMPLNTSLGFIMDRDLWIKYLLINGLNGIKKTNDLLVNFRLHNNSKTVGFNSDFYVERNSYFVKLAYENEMYELAEFLKQNYLIMDIELQKSMFKEKKLVYDSINYFLLLLVSEEYNKNNYNLSKKIFKKIDLKSLQKKDIHMLKALKLKMRFIPEKIRKIIK